MKAFVLGAGLGTQLRPLTEWLPKPMVPVYHRPLITYVFDHLRSLSGLEGFVVNTHHCAAAYAAAFPGNSYGGLPIAFRHEPVLLETAGGLANAADLLGGGDRFIVYNGDILSDIPLASLLEAHHRSGDEVTLLLRSEGPGLHIGLNRASGRVEDIRGMLGRGADAHYQFTGIYVVDPVFLQRLTAGKKESVIPIFLDMIRQGAALGGWIEDRGHWWDLGDEATYRQVHHEIPLKAFPGYASDRPWHRLSPSAKISGRAELGPEVIVGAETTIAGGAVVRDAILWPGARIEANAQVTGQVVRGDRQTHYRHFFP